MSDDNVELCGACGRPVAHHAGSPCPRGLRMREEVLALCSVEEARAIAARKPWTVEQAESWREREFKKRGIGFLWRR